jgi:ATP-binding cassette subfamily G (WHITE) protein 2
MSASVDERTPLMGQQPPPYTPESVGKNTIVVTMEDKSPRPSMIENAEGKGVLTFHDVSYILPMRKFLCIPAGRKVILNEVSGCMKPGVNAIMGPTGGGKTSLLDIIAGRKSSQRAITGDVLLDGHKLPKNYKCSSGYVVQDDVVMGTLSVRENLSFSAALRLPSSYTYQERKEAVDRVIEELSLQDCQNTKVGTEFIRGISGGERKRTNIGMELIISPQVLYLDEPTTGLDASTATSVVHLLKKLSRSGRTIIMSIHQPRYSIFKLFDSITLLSKGNLIYHGPARRSLEYFTSKGYVCEEHDNPADFYLDIIVQNEELASSSIAQPIGWNDGTVAMDASASPLAAQFHNSVEYQNLKNELNPILEGYKQRVNEGTEVRLKSSHYATGFPWQLLVLTWRSWLNVLRNPMTSVLQVVIMIFFGLLVGLVFFQLKSDLTGQGDRVGAIFFIIMNQVFGNLSAVELFIRQRAIFIHENASGFYRVSAFFLAKVFCDLIPLRIIPIAVFSVIVYFMIGFQVDVAKFFFFLLTLVLTSSTAAAIGFALSALVGLTAVANLLIALIFVLAMVFGGFLINLGSIPVWLSWLQYLSLFKFSIAALSVNEMEGQCYCADLTEFKSNLSSFNYTTPCDLLTKIPVLPCSNATAYLEAQHYLDYNIWYNELALGVFVIALLAWGYFNLRIVKKEK